MQDLTVNKKYFLPFLMRRTPVSKKIMTLYLLIICCETRISDNVKKDDCVLFTDEVLLHRRSCVVAKKRKREKKVLLLRGICAKSICLLPYSCSEIFMERARRRREANYRSTLTHIF